MSIGDKEMEPITEEDTPPNSANSVNKEESRIPHTITLIKTPTSQSPTTSQHTSQSQETRSMTDTHLTNQQQANKAESIVTSQSSSDQSQDLTLKREGKS